MRKFKLDSRGLIILGGVGSVAAFILASGPTVLREWSQLLRPSVEAQTTEGVVSDGVPRTAGDFAAATSALDAPPPVAVQTAAPANPPRVEILKLNIPLAMSVVGEGKDQPSACSAAVTEARSAATRRCERISLQNAGRRHEAGTGDDALECSGCAYVGDRWRCSARFTTQCKVYE